MLGTSKKMEIADRRKHVAEMYLKGQGQLEIAEKLNVDQSTISRDLKAIHEEWRLSAIRDFDLAKQIELERINRLEQEYWEAWEKSKSEKQISNKKSSKRSTSSQPDYVEIQVRTEQREGEARYLQGIQWCISERCRILGLHENKQTLEVVSAKDRLVGLIQAGRISFDVLVNQVGEDNALLFFKEAGVDID